MFTALCVSGVAPFALGKQRRLPYDACLAWCERSFTSSLGRHAAHMLSCVILSYLCTILLLLAMQHVALVLPPRWCITTGTGYMARAPRNLCCMPVVIFLDFRNVSRAARDRYARNSGVPRVLARMLLACACNARLLPAQAKLSLISQSVHLP